MPYDLDMRETGDRTYFGLSAGLAAALISALLFGATTPIAKQLLNGASPLLSGKRDGVEPHTHEHQHEPLRHSHDHFPDIHHRRRHG